MDKGGDLTAYAPFKKEHFKIRVPVFPRKVVRILVLYAPDLDEVALRVYGKLFGYPAIHN